MTTFTTYAQTKANFNEAIDFAIGILTNNGFAITQRGVSSVSLSGPGMNSTRQNPIVGVSKITLTQRGGNITAEAELGGVDRMQRFLMWFPMLLGLGLAALFGIGGGLLFGQQFGAGFGVPWAPGWQWLLVATGIAMLPVSPWLVLSPLMSRMIRKRTQHAVETLVRNAAFISRK